jgi:hypothetical protein
VRKESLKDAFAGETVRLMRLKRLKRLKSLLARAGAEVSLASNHDQAIMTIVTMMTI